MKADIDNNGVLVITPESNAEAMALRCWQKASFILQEDHTRKEQGKYLQQSIKLEFSL